MEMMSNKMAGPAMGGDMGSADAEPSAGYVIEIHVAGDKISVGVEPEEAPEEAGEAEDMQEVPSIREACKLVMTIYQSQGQAPDTAQDQADMSAGYGKS